MRRNLRELRPVEHFQDPQSAKDKGMQRHKSNENEIDARGLPESVQRVGGQEHKHVKSLPKVAEVAQRVHGKDAQ